MEALGDPAETVLVGFSQGANMALHAVADGLHGTADPLIPAALARATNTWLQTAGAAPNLRIFDGLVHSVDDRVLSMLGNQPA